MAASKPGESHSVRPKTEHPRNDRGQTPRGKTAVGLGRGADSLAPAARQWARILDAIPDPVAILDTQHRIIFANRSMAERLEVAQDDCVGQRCYACIHGSSEPPASCPHSRMLGDGREHKEQIHERQLGGDFLVSVSPLFDAEGRLEGAVHVARDITEQMRADRAVREGEQRFRDLAEMLPQTIYEMDLAGRLTFVNRNAFEIFGYTDEDFKAGVNNLDMLVPEEHERARQNVQRILQGEDLDGNEYTAQRKDGRRFPVAVYSSPIVREGRPVGLRGIIVDITQRKEAERALAQAKEAAEAADRAKSEFLANMSHEIRTPLTSILSLTDLLMEQEVRADARCQYLHMIGRNAENLLTLVSDILDLSRIEAGRTELELIDCSPRQIVEEVRSLMQIRANEKHLRLDVRFASLLPGTIRTDPVRLRQILVNLVGNAIKFTAEGSVRMTLGCCRRDDRRIGLRFEVADTGIGMTGDELKRIFRAFTQADASHTRRFGGTGLGLTISQKLARMLGGEIEAQSESGVGSTFILSLDLNELAPSWEGEASAEPESVPAVGAPEISPSRESAAEIIQGCRWPLRKTSLPQPAEVGTTQAKPPAAARRDPQVQGRILLAEDDPDVRRSLRLAVELSGAQVEFAENGRIAIEKAQASQAEGKPYDLILMDIQMPEVDGYEATRRLRQAGWGGPIVALTAHVMAGDREKSLAAGCDEYLSKPFRRADLIGMVTRHLRPALASAPLPSVASESTAVLPVVSTDVGTPGPKPGRFANRRTQGKTHDSESGSGTAVERVYRARPGGP